MEYDLVIYNGVIVTAADILPRTVYIGINHGIVETITTSKIFGKTEIDAEGGYVMPGGIDSHVHLDQDISPCGDDFESGSRSAVAGGTTSFLAFASQSKKEYDIFKVVDDYHQLATKNGPTYCDYGFHLIVSEPSPQIIHHDLKSVCEKNAITSVKVYMTYPNHRLTDDQLLNIFLANRKSNIMTMIHAENADIIDFINHRLEAKKLTDPYYHTVSRPQIAEDEASYRAISLAKLIDIPMLIVHMSSEPALDHVQKAQADNQPVFAETCPQYLFLTGEALKHDSHFHQSHEDQFQGAKYVCSPPLRESQKDLDGIWKHLMNGTITVFSSDHAPSNYDNPLGKKKGLVNGIPHYKDIPNGMPGIETRLPLLFCYGVERGKITPQRFVELTSTNPAKLYGLDDRKGTIGVGLDADLTIWYPQNQMKPFELTNEMLHHNIDYTPYEGMTFTNWPRYTIVKGAVCYDRDNGGIVGGKNGAYLKRNHASLGRPRSPLNPLFE